MDDKRHLSDLDPATPHAPAAPWSPAPGKRSMTQGLVPRAIIYRVEAPAASGARDANGVADGADTAVERAATSSGEPLRDDLRARFEGSLGADLSAVRVHRSADSAAASQAVGAQAYTVGQDIHFGAGKYQPDDPFGLHLLAHEVAHTVQQRGAPPSRQHKLEVSTPHDAAETEADRAADAMVRGAPAQVAAASTSIARAPVMTSPGYDGPSGWGDRGPEYQMGMPETAPNPKDPYNQPGVNWEAMAGATPGPDAPAASIAIGMRAHGPWPLMPTDETEARKKGIARVTHERRFESWDALNAAVKQLTSSWASAAPNIGQYHDAAGQFEQGGVLGPSPSGENWTKGAGKTYGDQALAQEGPVGRTTVKDLFTPKTTLGICKTDGSTEAVGGETRAVQGISQASKDAAKSTEVSKALEQARVEDGHVHDASTKYSDHISNKIRVAALNVDSAIQALEINKAGDDKDAATSLEKELGAQKAASALEMKSAIGMVTSVLGALATAGAAAAAPDVAKCADFSTPVPGAPEAPPSLSPSVAGGIKGAAEYVADRIAGLEFDGRIKEAHAKVEAATQKIKVASGKLANNNVAARMSELVSTIAALGELVNAVKEALKKRRDAYNAAASIAAAKVQAATNDPAQASRVAAAIAAIPKVQLVLSRVNMARWAIDPPAYTELSGVAFNVAQQRGGMDTATFVTKVGELKGYGQYFTKENTVWEGRLASLRELTGGMNVAGT